MAKTHSYEILQGLDDLRKHGLLCDVVLQVQQVQIPAHRAVLASCSPYFRIMFTTGLEECKKKIVRMNGVDGESLKNLVNFAYTGDIVVTRENVQYLLPAADLLELPNVRQMCSDYLTTELHPSNCIGIAKFAESYQCQELFRKSMKYMCDHFHAVCTEDEYFLLLEDELVRILSSDGLGVVNSEDIVFSATKAWIKYDTTARGHLLDNILHQCFRFTHATSKLLYQLQLNTDLRECKAAVTDAIEYKENKDMKLKFAVHYPYNHRQPSDAVCVIGGTNTRFSSLDRFVFLCNFDIIILNDLIAMNR